ncbi:MAG: IclR family transcriptional regulator [Bacillota bacterium]|nr:IclR family transcriptional regulator [Bacillota bacterium]
MSRSLERALSILALYNNDKKEWGISEISNELNLPKSTIHGLVATLAGNNFLYQNQNGKYRLGIKVFELGMAYSTNVDIGYAAEPFIKALLVKYNQSVHMAVFAGRSAVFIANNQAENGAGIFPHVGAVVSAYCTGVGKVLLAWQSPDYIENYLAQEHFLPVTKNTITTTEDLRLELQKIKQQGYSLDHGEALTDTGCISAPILGPEGQILAAISISGPIDQVLNEKTMQNCIQDVMDAAHNISRVMGFSGSLA